MGGCEILNGSGRRSPFMAGSVSPAPPASKQGRQSSDTVCAHQRLTCERGVSHMPRLVIVLLIVPVVLAAQSRAKNVILFLADAGGIPTIHAASLHGYGAPRRLFIQRMPHIALSDTSSASRFVTDSAAGMTAIVTGHKTNNNMVAQSASGERGVHDGEPLKTILEHAEERGLSTGIITNDSLAGATPAALY